MIHKLSCFILKISGWKIVGELPALDKFVICLAPHTSNLDFFVGKMACNVLGLNINFLIKREWLRFPLGRFMRRQGAIAIDRKHHTNMTGIMAEKFRHSEKMFLAITPEGTRKRNPNWKMGFYYIARGAGVPILTVGMDYERKVVEILGLFYTTDDVEADIKRIKLSFVGQKGKYPERFTIGEV